MELKFKANQTGDFAAWLKGFKDIHTTLLVEVDIANQLFVAKCFPPEKSIVKYSAISFQDAGVELQYIADNDGNAIEDWQNTYGKAIATGDRIKIGLYNMISTFVDVISMFSAVEHTITMNFDIDKKVKYINSAPGEPLTEEYSVVSIKFKSATLAMNVKCTALSDFFQKCSDDTFFNRVCKIDNPVSFDISIDAIGNLIKISSVVAQDKVNDAIKFYTKSENGQCGLYALDYRNGVYDYLLSYSDNPDTPETDTVVFRSNFINATKGLSDNMKITLDNNNNTRILIESGSSKIVVAAVQNR